MNTHRFDSSICKSVGRAVLAAACAKAAIVTVAALVSLGASVLAGDTAEAKPVSAGSCTKKYNACLTRCREKYDVNKLGSKAWADKVVACSTRTCSKQYDNCMANAFGPGGGSGGKVQTPGGHNPRPDQASGPYLTGSNKHEPKIRNPETGPYSPIGNGILDAGPSLHGQGPSVTGSPASGGGRAPAAAPIQLR